MQKAKLEKKEIVREQETQGRQKYTQGSTEAKWYRPSRHLTGLSLALSPPCIWQMGKLRPRDGENWTNPKAELWPNSPGERVKGTPPTCPPPQRKLVAVG